MTFRELSTAVLDQAEERASTPFDRARVEQRALVAGAPRARQDTARLAWQLLADLETGHAVPAALAGALATRLATRAASTPDTLAPLSDWF